MYLEWISIVMFLDDGGDYRLTFAMIKTSTDRMSKIKRVNTKKKKKKTKLFYV
jgi:hypothetical protein